MGYGSLMTAWTPQEWQDGNSGPSVLCQRLLDPAGQAGQCLKPLVIARCHAGLRSWPGWPVHVQESTTLNSGLVNIS